MLRLMRELPANSNERNRYLWAVFQLDPTEVARRLIGSHRPSRDLAMSWLLHVTDDDPRLTTAWQEVRRLLGADGLMLERWYRIVRAQPKLYAPAFIQDLVDNLVHRSVAVRASAIRFLRTKFPTERHGFNPDANIRTQQNSRTGWIRFSARYKQRFNNR